MMLTPNDLTTSQSGEGPWADNPLHKPLLTLSLNFPWKPSGSVSLLSTICPGPLAQHLQHTLPFLHYNSAAGNLRGTRHATVKRERGDLQLYTIWTRAGGWDPYNPQTLYLASHVHSLQGDPLPDTEPGVTCPQVSTQMDLKGSFLRKVSQHRKTIVYDVPARQIINRHTKYLIYELKETLRSQIQRVPRNRKKRKKKRMWRAWKWIRRSEHRHRNLYV